MILASDFADNCPVSSGCAQRCFMPLFSEDSHKDSRWLDVLDELAFQYVTTPQARQVTLLPYASADHCRFGWTRTSLVSQRRSPRVAPSNSRTPRSSFPYHQGPVRAGCTAILSDSGLHVEDRRSGLGEVEFITLCQGQSSLVVLIPFHRPDGPLEPAGGLHRDKVLCHVAWQVWSNRSLRITDGLG